MKKTACVTGASEGIGRSFAVALARQGYTVTAVARTESKLKQLMSEIGPGHDYCVADLSDSAGQDKVADQIRTRPFDLLINNAGVGSVGLFHEAPVDKQLAMMSLNMTALVKLSHVFLAGAKSGDALVNVSSTLAFLPMPGISLYSATKAFVTSFSEGLWFENKDRGVFVMGLCPGITATNFQVNAGGKKDDIPKNMAQTPEQVVECALEALRSRHKPSVISGTQNAFLAGLTRLMPRRSVVKMMGDMALKMKPKTEATTR